ncbi:MAG: HAMP domain-containing histidine kinase [Alteromonadaceae bacterium]|nr:HAMP domain-containing histidine kinase [Alteromonadaceae bacterium]
MLLLIYLLYSGGRRPPVSIILMTVVVEILLVNASIAVNGAASNPFSSILLVPLVLGLALLPFKYGLAVLGISIAAQGAQLVLPTAHRHGDMMQQHAQGMIVSFILTSLLIATVILYFRLQLSAKAAAIQKLRERQLRDEQLLAIGTAAAQLTHDAATPIQTMHLILEELQETPSASLVDDLSVQFRQLQHLLHNWRQVADDVRESRISAFSASDLIRGIRRILLLARPEADINWPAPDKELAASVTADRTLLPALSSIVINACDAANGAPVKVTTWLDADTLCFKITNPVSADKTLPPDFLGARLVESQTGFGAGAILSNATIEKFGGKVNWNSDNQHVITIITLPRETI